MAKFKTLGRLLWMWGTMGILVFLLMMAVYTLFFARLQREYAPHIYEDHLLIYKAGSTQLFTKEGYGLTSYGSNGQVVNKPIFPGRFTILIQGDSYVQAKQVDDAEKFTELVEHQWNTTYPNKPIQTINIGLEGQSISSYITFASTLDTHYQPDLLILVVSAKDFPTIEQFDTSQTNILKRQVTQNTSSPLRIADQLGLRAFFAQLQLQTRGFLQEQVAVEEERPLIPHSQTTYAMHLAQLQAVWGERLVLVLNPPVTDTPEGQMATVRFLQAVEQQGIPLIDLTESLQIAQASNTPPRGFNNSIMGQGHWNKMGHELVANEIVLFLERHEEVFTP